MSKASQIKLKYVAELFNGNSISDDQKSEFEGKAIPYIPTKEINVENGKINYYNGLSVDESDGFRIAPADSVLICIEGGSAGKKIAFTDRPVAFVNKLCCLRAKNIYPKYLYYALKSKDFTDQFYLNMTGLIGGVTVTDLKNLFITIPQDYDYQKKISIFIDQKCRQIDSLIANVHIQIEKLLTYKQSLIAEAVTHGISPNVTMKDSETKWLGKVPAHWLVERGKNLFFETDTRSIDGTEELLTVSQYTGVTPRSQKNVNMFEALTLEGYKICEPGDIAANTMWLWAGAIGVSNFGGVISPSYNVYRQKSDAFLPTYLDYLLRSSTLVQEYASLSTGIRASRLRLYPKDFLNIRFPVPPKEEQQMILDYLENHFAALDTLITKKQTKIEKLELYKKSLIYEYVTGKKEVQ